MRVEPHALGEQGQREQRAPGAQQAEQAADTEAEHEDGGEEHPGACCKSVTSRTRSRGAAGNETS